MKTTANRQPALSSAPFNLSALAASEPADALITLLQERSGEAALTLLRGEEAPLLNDVPDKTTSLIVFAAQLISTFLTRPSQAELHLLLGGSAHLGTPLLNRALNAACAGWPAAQVREKLTQLGGDSHSINPKSFTWQTTFPTTLDFAAISDGLRVLAGLEPGALESACAAQRQEVSATLIQEAVQSATRRLGSNLTLSRSERLALLDWNTQTLGHNLTARLKEWTALFPESHDAADLPPDLSAATGLGTHGPLTPLAWTLRGYGHPLAPLSTDWMVELPDLPSAPLRPEFKLEELTDLNTAAADVSSALGSLQELLRRECPPAIRQDALRAFFSGCQAPTPTGQLLLALTGGRLCSGNPWGQTLAGQSALLSRASRLAAGMARLICDDPGSFASEATLLRGGQARALARLSRRNWPTTALCLLMLSELRVRIHQTNIESPLPMRRSGDASPEWGEALLEYWQAAAVTVRAVRRAEEACGFSFPKSQERSPTLPRHLSQQCTLAVHRALNARQNATEEPAVGGTRGGEA